MPDVFLSLSGADRSLSCICHDLLWYLAFGVYTGSKSRAVFGLKGVTSLISTRVYFARKRPCYGSK